MSEKREFVQGITRTIPLLLGAFPFGFIYGALGVSAGFSPLAIAAMSLLVFAGSAQFIAVGLFSTQTPVLIILLITFVVNLRHLLYSLSLMSYLKHLPQPWRAALAFWLTDETYAVTIFRYQENTMGETKHWFQFGSSVAMYVNWQIWSILGILVGERISEAGNWGLDVAMPITFIGMVLPFIKSTAMMVCVITSGAAALLTFSWPYKLGLIVATLSGILAGMLVSRIKGTSGSKL